MRIAYLLLSFVLVTGCDGHLAIKGQLESSSSIGLSGDCQARLEGLSYTENLLEVDEDGGFRTGWVVAPKKQTYQVVFFCSDHIETRRNVEYGNDVEPGRAADLGKIILSRKPVDSDE